MHDLLSFAFMDVVMLVFRKVFGSVDDIVYMDSDEDPEAVDRDQRGIKIKKKYMKIDDKLPVLSSMNTKIP